MIFFVRSPDLKHIPLNIDHSFQIHIRPTCSTCVYIGCSKTPKVQSNCQFWDSVSVRSLYTMIELIIQD